MNDNVEISWCRPVFKLDPGCVQTLIEALFRLCVSLTQTLLQLLDGWWLDEHEDGVQVGISDLLDAFDLDVQHADLAVFLNVFYRFFAKTENEKDDEP